MSLTEPHKGNVLFLTVGFNFLHFGLDIVGHLWYYIRVKNGAIIQRKFSEMMIVIDVETTGLDMEVDELLQVSIIDENKNVLFNEYIKPLHTKCWEKAMEVNGITPAMVVDKNVFSVFREEVQKIVNEADTICGYNVFFDIDFLANNGIVFDGKKIIDVMEMFAEFYGDWNDYQCSYKRKKLIYASAYFDYCWEEEAHNSLGDIKATLFITS